MLTSTLHCAVLGTVSLLLITVDEATCNQGEILDQDDPDTPVMELTFLPEEGDSRCLDGSRAGFYYRPSRSERGANRWIVYLEGGGLCYDPSSCHSRMESNLGSSNYWDQNKTGIGPQNPDFWDAHHLFIPYCTGDLHVGTKSKKGIETFGGYFSGHLNFKSVIDFVSKKYIYLGGIKNASDIMLAGDSAGGMGTFYNLDYLAEQVPGVPVKGVPIGGWFFPGFAADQPNTPWAPPSIFNDFQNNKTGTTALLVAYLNTLYGAYLPPNCVKAEAQDFHCATVNVLYPYITSPVFVLQNMYDTNQIYSELFMPHCSYNPPSCTDEQEKFAAYFGDAVRKSTKQVLDNTRKKDGIFLPSCWAHCEGINVDGRYDINGFHITELVGDWYFERYDRNPYQVVDDCPDDLPCNPSCPHMVPEPRPGPETQCETELNTLCDRMLGCLKCAYEHMKELDAAGCTTAEVESLCN